MRKFYICFADGNIAKVTESTYEHTRGTFIELDLFSSATIKPNCTIMFVTIDMPKDFPTTID